MCIKNRVLFIFFFAAISLRLFYVSGEAFADSCPYCGQEYGDPMPGDEDRVYEMRRKHEAECGARHSSSTSSGQYSEPTRVYKDPYQQQIKEHEADQAESIRKRQETMARRKQEIMRYEEQEVITKENVDAQKEIFNRKKERLVSSLKKRSSLSIKEVPAPLSAIKYGQDKIRGDRPDGSPSGGESVMRTTLKNSYKKTAADIKDNSKESILKNTVDNIPGVGYAREIYEKYKKMRENMEELNLNLFQYAMKGVKEGIRSLASGNISDGGLADEYEEGRETLFGKTLTKSREMLKDEVGTD